VTRATVTGADGFVGQWLLRHLLENDYEITGLVRGTQPSLSTLDPRSAAKITWHAFELADLERAKATIGESRPDVLFHLAAQSSVPESIAHPLETIAANVAGTLNVLEACRAGAPDATLVVVGSADSYGAKSADSMPLREDMPLEPRNPYAASKAAAEILALQYARIGRNRIVVTRSFNHAGPGQSTKFALASFAKQVADVKARRRPPHIRVGALQPRRDITDVRDIVRAYGLLAQAGQAGTVYNVCSGTDHSMREALDTLIWLAGVQVEIIEDQALLRAAETLQLVGDPARIKRDTGWQPAIAFERTLSDMLGFYGS
jgi:GDP-4-dehydro-6-deoxy-D-mannose reductase